MQPELKSQDCHDHDPIEEWEPASTALVDYWLTMRIGEPNRSGADMFTVNVLSVAAAKRLSAADLASRKKIVLEDYSWAAVLGTRMYPIIKHASSGASP